MLVSLVNAMARRYRSMSPLDKTATPAIILAALCEGRCGDSSAPDMGDTMDRLEAMTIVLLAVEKGSLTAAAKALNTPLPTVSRKVSELEAYLGTKLLQRSTRKLTLTDAGQNYIS